MLLLKVDFQESEIPVTQKTISYFLFIFILT
jgi:hypothetical protein